MRARSIKPGIFENEILGTADPIYTVLFAGLWCCADKAGRLEDRPLKIKGQIFRFRDGLDIESALTWLADNNFIVRYKVKGDKYIQIVNFEKHQHPHHTEKDSQITPYSGGLTVKKRKANRGTPSDSRLLNPESRILNPDDMSATPTGRVFEHWRKTHGHPKATLDAKRRKLIGRALESYSEADLCLCITGYLNSPHHMGQNDRATKYDDIELFLRDAKHIDAGIRFHAEPPSTLSKLTRQNIASTEGWLPPELRNGTD